MVAKSPAPMSSSSESRISRSICGLTKISIRLTPSSSDFLELVQANPQSANFLFELPRLVAFFLNHFLFRFSDKFVIGQLLVHAAKLVFNLTYLLQKPGVLFVKIDQIVQRQINLCPTHHGGRRSLGTIADWTKIRRTYACQHPQIGPLCAQ